MPRVWEQVDRCSELKGLRRRGSLTKAICGQGRREGGYSRAQLQPTWIVQRPRRKNETLAPQAAVVATPMKATAGYRSLASLACRMQGRKHYLDVEVKLQKE